jgi:DNA-binding transcriptional ArsR family regulator
MALLRAAHLVRVVDRGTLKYYRLRPDRLREAAEQGLAFLAASGPPRAEHARGRPGLGRGGDEGRA